MPRMWAQEWRSNAGQQRFSLHRNKDDITVFGIRHNKANEHADKLSEVAKPYMANTTVEWYNYVCDSSYGRLVNWRP